MSMDLQYRLTRPQLPRLTEGSEEDVVHHVVGEDKEGCCGSKASNPRGEAGKEEGGVRREDEEPDCSHPQGGSREEILKCEDMAASHRSKGATPAKKFLGCF